MKYIVLKKKKKANLLFCFGKQPQTSKKNTLSDIIKTEVALSQQIRPQRKNKLGLQIK